MKKRVLFWGDAIASTGFATVLHNIIGNLPKRSFDRHQLGINYKGDPHDYDWRIYPALIGGDYLGLNRIAEFATLKPDGIFILNDVWVIGRFLRKIKETWKDIPPIVVYFPVDSIDLDLDWFKDFDIVKKVVVYTKFGYNEVKKIIPNSEIEIIPHGTDTSIFYKKFETREEAKKLLFPNQDLKESCIVLNANRNQPRKRIDLTIQAFSIFAKNKPKDVKLYLHMGIKDMGFDILKLCYRYGVDERLIISNTKKINQSVPIEKLNLIYNAADIGLNTCYIPGTKILTESGYKNIENVRTNDKVFSHSGKPSKVTNTFKFKKDNEDLIKITPYGILPFTVTKNHKLFSVLSPYLKLERKYKEELRNNINPDFIESKLLMEGSLLTFPIIKDEKVSIGIEKAFLYGAYAAEGSSNKSGITFSLDSRIYDDDLRNEIIDHMKSEYGLEPHPYNRTRNRQDLNFFSVKLPKEYKEKLGPNAHNKKIPSELLFMKRDEKLAFLRGAILGDGHIDHNTITYTTVSEELAWQIWFILTTLGNVTPSITRRTRGEYCVRIYGKGAINLARECEILGKSKKLIKPIKQQRPKIFIVGDYIYYPIRKIENVGYTGLVYDLEVEGEHSYLSHIAGHNSIGEGWGLVNSEHATTGAPQIVPNHSALTEIYNDSGLLVPIFQWLTNPDTLTVSGYVHPVNVANRLEELYQNKELYNELSKKSLDKWTDEKASWEYIVKNQWVPLLKDAYKV